MRCEHLFALLILFVACSREAPAPSSSSSEPPPAPTTTTTAAQTPVTAAEAAGADDYGKAMDWFRTASRFAFVLDESGVHAEGTMTRENVGAEIVEFRANGEEWRARATAQGVTWEKREGGRWSNAPSGPAYGNRLYQRVTLAFDPQKKEGAAQLVEPKHFRFTNANTGEVHDVWVDAKGRVERIRIGESFELKITP